MSCQDAQPVSVHFYNDLKIGDVGKPFTCPSFSRPSPHRYIRYEMLHATDLARSNRCSSLLFSVMKRGHEAFPLSDLMFYVFYVNEGSLQALEVSVALGSVHKLQCVIEEITRVPIAEQALLVSGGEGLQSEKQVSHYQGAGTESNPLFLFRKLYKEESQCTEPTNSDELCTLCAGLYDELRVLDSSTISRPLITRYCDAGRLGLKVAERSLQLCARLVQDHQLLHQGWLALISNLYESRIQIEKKSERFLSRYERLKTMKTKAETLLQDFDNVLCTLQQIKIPSALLSNSYKLQGSSKATEECTLYEYIARADSQNSLEEMSEQVNMLLSKMSDTEYRQVVSNMRYVSEKVGNPEMRNIRGINTRLTQLDAMFHSKEQETKILKDLCFAVSQPAVDSQSTRDVVLNQREKMLEVKKLIEQMQKMGKAFQQSKIELLNNIRTRLRGWILQVYDRLHTTNNQIILFEEKYIALRNRLDIIRQVKESPIMFATALTECLRRSVLQPEFESWFTSFMEKSIALVTEETSVREVFKQKLGRHFLKQLFPGMFDNFPNFAPSGLAYFDKNLPPVAPADLRTLRQAVPCLTNLLRVTDPFIYQRLSVRDPRFVSGTQVTLPVLKREESFYTTDTTINVANLNKNFPSTHWLSGDENLDALPSNATMLAKSPPSRFGSTLSLNMVEESPAKPLNSLASLFDASHSETVGAEVGNESKTYSGRNVTKSEPIAIPRNNVSVLQVDAPLIEEGNSVKPKSDKSSQFGTPEDHISYQQRINSITDVFERSQSGNLLFLQNELKRLLLQLMHLKQELILAEKQTREYSTEALRRISNSLITFVGYRKTVSVSHQPKPIYKDVAIETEMKDEQEKSSMVSDVLISELRQVIELQKEEILQLRQQQLSAKNTVAKMEIERSEMYKTLVVDYELALERKVSSHSEEIKRKNKEIDSLKAVLHKLRGSVVSQSAENTASVFADDEIGTNCEKEYKEKYTVVHEDCLLGRVPVHTKERYSVASELIDSEESTVISSVPNDLSKGCLLKSFTVNHEASSAMESSKVKTEDELKDSYKDENADEERRGQADSDEDIVPVTIRPATVQTTISLREMRTMITVQDIHEYCAVLIVWSEPHNAYILFSISPIFHFVKESSLKRMGIKWDRQSSAVAAVNQRPNWLMAITTRLELCKIRKTDNRYNLKVGTKFYRVEVEPLQIDSSSIRRRADE
ncbi:RB1-inducible coiled-coil protein [Dirofilaria immitis]